MSPVENKRGIEAEVDKHMKLVVLPKLDKLKKEIDLRANYLSNVQEVFHNSLTIKLMEQIHKEIESGFKKCMPEFNNYVAQYVDNKTKEIMFKIDENQKKNDGHQERSDKFIQEAKPILDALKVQKEVKAENVKGLIFWAKISGAITTILAAIWIVYQNIIRPIISSIK